MRIRHTLATLLGLMVLLIGSPSPVRSEEVRVAVAANFAGTLEDIILRFEESSPHRVLVSVGSTGKLHAQITNGAPFHLFMAADVERPAKLEAAGIGVPDTRKTYARGQVALWVPGGANLSDPADAITGLMIGHMAVANPDLAPYGRAARQVLEALGHWNALQRHAVRGQNIGQTYQFVASGSARSGWVALSQLRDPNHEARGNTWIPPQEMYDPIDQQMILLERTIGALAFYEYMQSESAGEIKERFGYLSP